MRVCAVIVAGGRSSRMGREKTFELVGGRTILERIIARLRMQVDEVIINANGDLERFGRSGLAVIGDLRPDAGSPLAGLHTALRFASGGGFDSVLTVPSDTPFLPADLANRLAAARHPAAIAASDGQTHFLTGLWSAMLLGKAEDAMLQPRIPRVQDWARQCDAAIIQWPAEPYDPFFNVNTPQELAEAQRIAADFAP
jgi:molybdopterin-guanine dinucleotide biosynthesis protein A